ncbi:hypothetical protein AB5I41_09950 [Sphingomonas sp. MMS24-JH45]
MDVPRLRAGGIDEAPGARRRADRGRRLPRSRLPAAAALAGGEELDVVRWTDMPRGGHFAALEQPEAFVDDLLGLLATID